MLTWAIRRHPSGSAAAGFTLLELVVVLALIGLATALVAPRGFRTIETWRRATRVDAALGALAALGAQAQAQGRRIEFAPGELSHDDVDGLPADWQVILEHPLVVQPNGACSDTSGELRSGTYVRRFALRGPYCRVVLDAPPGA